MKQKTAIRQLIEYLQATRDKLPLPLYTAYSQGRDFTLMYAIEKAKELEPVNEQQIKDAFAEGHARFTECEESELEDKAIS